MVPTYYNKRKSLYALLSFFFKQHKHYYKKKKIVYKPKTKRVFIQPKANKLNKYHKIVANFPPSKTNDIFSI